MDALNFTIKADWIERIDKLNPEQRQLTVMAIYDYMVYGKLSKNDYVNFAISWIRDEIDRMKKARERRDERRRQRIEEKRPEAEEQKNISEAQALPGEEPETPAPEITEESSQTVNPQNPNPPRQATHVSRTTGMRGRSLNFRDYKKMKSLDGTVHQILKRKPNDASRE